MASVAKEKTFLIMAGGTGGHIYPALAVAQELMERNHRIHWLGSQNGMEQKVVSESHIPIALISISGLRGKGKVALLKAPFKVIGAVLQAIQIIRAVKPDCVLGMGGFASGPGGVAAWLLRKPLVIHEQNAIAGLTNKLLSRFAQRVLCAFPGAFDSVVTHQVTGNPLRKAFLISEGNQDRKERHSEKLRVLILGGSLGAAAINRVVPEALTLLKGAVELDVRHQCGSKKLEEAKAEYRKHQVEGELVPFIADMNTAYRWADVVICRAGAMTVAEVSAVGVASIMVPFPYAVDDHQTANAACLASADAACLVQESEFTPQWLAEKLTDFATHRQKLQEMGKRAKESAHPEATQVVAQVCEEVCYG